MIDIIRNLRVYGARRNSNDKRVEQETTDVLSLSLRFLPEAVIVIEPGLNNIVFVNRAFERLSGYSLDELKGKGLALLQGPETDRTTFRQLLSLAAGETAVGDLRLYKKDQQPFWDRVSSDRVETAEGAFTVQVHQDVTQSKELEKRFVALQRNEDAGELIRGLAHDLNNSLTSILVYSGLLQTKAKNDETLRRYADQVQLAAEKGGRQAAELINRIREELAEPDMMAEPGVGQRF